MPPQIYQQGYTGLWCVACDQAGTPAQMTKKMSGTQRGMLLRCTRCRREYEYSQFMTFHPRSDKPDSTERPPAHTITKQVWVYPEVWAALETKFPTNLLTTLCAILTSLGDSDTVLIEGEHARELAQLGIHRGREILGLAREVIQLRKTVEEMRIREQALAPLFQAMGGAFGAQPAPGMAPAGTTPATDTAVLTDGHRNPDLPPISAIGTLVEDADGLLVPGVRTEPAHPFTMTGPAEGGGSWVPGFVEKLVGER